MKKKIVISGILTCIFIIVAGVIYSCNYHNRKDDSTLITSLLEQEDETITKEISKVNETNETREINKTDEINETNVIGIDNDTSKDETLLSKKDTKDIYIHICGAVVNPDVYQVINGSRLVEIIDLAGGLCENAAGDYINQAQLVVDGQRIYIPTKEEVVNITIEDYLEGEKEELEEVASSNVLVNINKADMDELMTLPGIGKAKAESIVEYRNTNGKFKAIDELMNITGIKEGLFEQLSSYVIVND